MRLHEALRRFISEAQDKYTLFTVYNTQERFDGGDFLSNGPGYE